MNEKISGGSEEGTFGFERPDASDVIRKYGEGRLSMTSNDPDYGKVVSLAARELHTKAYLENGFIEKEDINERGLFEDEYSDRSTYVLAQDHKIISACRYIASNRKDGIMSLPTAKHFSIDPREIESTIGGRIADLAAREVIEISGLASSKHTHPESDRIATLDATRLLYSQILRDSVEKGHRLWLLNTHERLIRSLEALLGKDQVHRLGEPKEYMGSVTVPAAINPQEVVLDAFEDDSEIGKLKQSYLRQTLPGMSGKRLTKKMKQMLIDNEINYEEQALARRILLNPKTIANVALSAYAGARAAPLAMGGVEGFHGNAAVFLAIDVGTIPPYVWGIANMATGKTRARRLWGTTVAGGSFSAPYVYFWSQGENYPLYVNAIAGGLVAAGGLGEVLKIRKNRRISKELEAQKDI